MSKGKTTSNLRDDHPSLYGSYHDYVAAGGTLTEQWFWRIRYVAKTLQASNARNGGAATTGLRGQTVRRLETPGAGTDQPQIPAAPTSSLQLPVIAPARMWLWQIGGWQFLLLSPFPSPAGQTSRWDFPARTLRATACIARRAFAVLLRISQTSPANSCAEPSKAAASTQPGDPTR